MVSSRIFAALFLFSSIVVAQSIDPSKVGTVHVYREGRLLKDVAITADGENVVALSPHKIATFYLFPGYHQLTLESGEISPTAFFKAEAGGEYFFQVSYEHVVSATSIRDLRVGLSMQERFVGEAELREVTIDQSKLIEILALSHPCGAESTGPNLTNVIMDPNPKNPERSPCLAANQVIGQ
jgi:hypothetical protein